MAKKYKNLKLVRHAHGCTRCAVRYEDACENPQRDGLCTTCRGGRAWQLLRDNALPRDCCRQKSKLVTHDQKVDYQLAGTRLWFICPVCARTHPFDPRTDDRRAPE